MVLIMEKLWYRKLFSRTPKPDRQAAPAEAGSGDADADAQFSLGLKYANSEGAAQDYVQAAQWYRKAADQSHSLAQFNLGMMYANGQGVPRDDAQAMIWFHKAAHQGDAGAQFNLGMCHRRASVGWPPADALESRIEAYKWFHLAAAQGYKDSVTACESVNLSMTREEVAEGNHRAAAFVAVTTAHPQVH